jgi:hypothetical protein
MKSMISAAVICSLIALPLVGCSETETTKRETKITTPGGYTTISIEKETTKTGENPPPAAP